MEISKYNIKWWSKFRKVYKYFKIDEIELEKSADMKGETSTAYRAWNFYNDVKKHRIRNLTKDQIDYLFVIKEYQNTYGGDVYLSKSRLEIDLERILYKHHGVTNIDDSTWEKNGNNLLL